MLSCEPSETNEIFKRTMTPCGDNRWRRGLLRSMCCAQERTRRNTSAFDVCPNCPVDTKSHAKWNIVSLGPDRKQRHVEQLSKCAGRRDFRIKKTISKVRLMDSFLHHVCFIYFGQRRCFQRSQNGTSNAMPLSRLLLRPKTKQPCMAQSQQPIPPLQLLAFNVASFMFLSLGG